MEKSIKYGIRSPESEGDFDRRPVVNNEGKEPSYDFGKREKSGMPIMKRVSITYFTSNPMSGNSNGNHAKQKKMQGMTGGQGRGGDHFGKPKGSSSKVGGVSSPAKQKKGFGGQTTTQY